MKRASEMKRWIILGFIVSLAFSCDTENSIAPPEDFYFKKYYGGEGDQEGVDMIVNSDGTLLLFGTTRLPSQTSQPQTSQLYLVKTDERGKVLWEKTYGGSRDEEAVDIELTNTTTGEIVMVGNTQTAIGDWNIMIMTLTADGVRIDSSGYSLPGNFDEVANSVTKTNDGFIVAGYTTNVSNKPTGQPTPLNDQRDALHVRFYTQVSQPYPTTWFDITGPGTIDEATKVIEYTTNNFYWFGTSNKPRPGGVPENNFWAFSLGAGGTSNSTEIQPGLSSSSEICNAVVPILGTNGFIMIGSSVDANANSSMYLTKLRDPLGFINSAGIIELEKTISTTSLTGISVYALNPSGFLVLGNELTANGDNSIYLSKLTDGLASEWKEQTSLIFGGACEDTAGAVTELPDGRIMIIGTIRTGDECESKMALIKVSKEGKFEK